MNTSILKLQDMEHQNQWQPLLQRLSLQENLAPLPLLVQRENKKMQLLPLLDLRALILLIMVHRIPFPQFYLLEGSFLLRGMKKTCNRGPLVLEIMSGLLMYDFVTRAFALFLLITLLDRKNCFEITKNVEKPLLQRRLLPLKKSPDGGKVGKLIISKHPKVKLIKLKRKDSTLSNNNNLPNDMSEATCNQHWRHTKKHKKSPVTRTLRLGAIKGRQRQIKKLLRQK
mmetsp:Transcript_28173/g.43633  ORF Transcript_28173/g.43633 Transcript_28173/m.43633 type:complete len:227 (-) Transcript_28173:863-1543(-)